MTMLGLTLTFLRIGTLAFGGLGAALTLIERELVQSRRILSAEDLTEALTYTKLLPGSTVVQVVSYLGYKLGGWPGSALATAAFVLPSAVAMVVLAGLYLVVTSLPAITPAVQGLTAAVVGILLATTYRLGKSNIKDAPAMATAVVAFAAGAFLDLNAALIVVVAGLIGVLLLASPTRGGEPKKAEA